MLRGYKEDNWSNNTHSWKAASIQRGLEPEIRGIATVRSLYQATTSDDIAGWKRLSCDL
jgi:hypothetical protein